MLLYKLALYHFRNKDQLQLVISPHLTVLLGENARGKTNILESIYFLINGVGFRESKEEELLQIGYSDGSVAGVFSESHNRNEFRIVYKKNNDTIIKTYLISRTKKRYQQYALEQTKAVLFAPEHIEIITGSPDARRSYFNKVISFYDPEYKKRIVNLENAIRRRNKIFDHRKDDLNLREELLFWNTYIVDQASYITEARKRYIEYLNSHSRLDHKEFVIEYMKNEATMKRFEEFFQEEKRWHRTLIGPQKDEFQILLKSDGDKNIHHYGSRSEQRLGVFWLKMNEITYYEDKFKKKPILLLDDIFSEFDKDNKKMIIDLIKQYQTILTTTEDHTIETLDFPKTIIKV